MDLSESREEGQLNEAAGVLLGTEIKQNSNRHIHASEVFPVPPSLPPSLLSFSSPLFLVSPPAKKYPAHLGHRTRVYTEPYMLQSAATLPVMEAVSSPTCSPRTSRVSEATSSDVGSNHPARE